MTVSRGAQNAYRKYSANNAWSPNLLTNAAKFTPEGGQIELRVTREGAEAVIRVRDSGIGMAPSLLPRVFDLFSQADTSLAHSQGGLGIGLALAQMIVQQHGGSIQAYSEGEGRGSEFIACLPALQEPDNGRPSGEAKHCH